MIQCLNTLSNADVLLLVQDLVLVATGIVVVLYTRETKRMREQMVIQNTTLAEQLRLMRADAANTDRKEKSLLDPLFKPAGGDGAKHYHNFKFKNAGGLIRNLEVATDENLQVTIRPRHVLACGEDGVLSVTRSGNQFGDNFPQKGKISISYNNSIGDRESKSFEFRTDESVLLEIKN